MRFFAIDVSGGMSPSMKGEVAADIRKRGHALDFVCFFDTVIRKEMHVAGDIEECISYLGGGTTFQSVIDWATHHGSNTEAVTIYTDGAAPAPIVPEGMEVEIVYVLVDGARPYPTPWAKLIGTI